MKLKLDIRRSIMCPTELLSLLNLRNPFAYRNNHQWPIGEPAPPALQIVCARYKINLASYIDYIGILLKFCQQAERRL